MSTKNNIILRIGITGQAGFVGTHLYNTLRLHPEKFEVVDFEDSYFDNFERLCEFVKNCDVIVHLAAMNRHTDAQVIYDTNVRLNTDLVRALKQTQSKAHVMFSSSIQESLDNPYGRSKKVGRELIEQWAKNSGSPFTGLIIANIFGEFARPNYNTFIATFASKLIAGEQPTVMVDNSVKLIYVGSLCKFILSQMTNQGIKTVEVPFDFERKVTEVLHLFEQFNYLYGKQGIIPTFNDQNEVNLFNTFCSYLKPQSHFLTLHADERGSFVEVLKTGSGGQVSYSFTNAGVTRGNHYHTRKIERFIVTNGTALIQLRKIGTSEVHNFELSGTSPSYIDMPVWYTHNITNIGQDTLFTMFWINEWFNPNDTDTYFEKI